MNRETVQTFQATDVKQAITLQKQLAAKVEILPLQKRVRLIGGVDAAFPTGKNSCLAGVVVMRFPEMEIAEEVHAEVDCHFPYIPGMLSFREAPAILAAIRKLENLPDLLLVDGQGLAHPRRFGLACHLGLELGLPTIGCAKSRLIGRHVEPAHAKGSQVDLMDKDQVVGRVLRSRAGVKPLYISVGHLIDLDGAVDLVLRCCGRYRLPEPTRLADKLVGRLRQEVTQSYQSKP